MDKEDIRNLWTQFIVSLKYSISQPSNLFTEPNCGTCAHWRLVEEDAMKMISQYSPDEYEQICLGMKGKILKCYVDEDDAVSYYVHRFYGFCKRFPPTWPESNSIIRWGLFSRINVKTPKVLSGYRFPFLPHDEQCGEWKQGEWARAKLSELQRQKD